MKGHDKGWLIMTLDPDIHYSYSPIISNTIYKPCRRLMPPEFLEVATGWERTLPKVTYDDPTS